MRHDVNYKDYLQDTLTSMTTSDELFNFIDAFKLSLRRLFGIKTNYLKGDSSTKEAYRTRKAQSDWFEQTHGISDSGAANQKGRT